MVKETHQHFLICCPCLARSEIRSELFTIHPNIPRMSKRLGSAFGLRNQSRCDLSRLNRVESKLLEVKNTTHVSTAIDFLVNDVT